MVLKFLYRRTARRLGKAMYVLLLASCLVFLMILLKGSSDVKKAPKVPEGATTKIIIPVANKTGLGVRSLPPPSTNTTSNRSATFLITAGVTGRLGNQMFQYASLLGVASMNNMKPFYPSNLLSNIFEVTHIQRWPQKGFHVVNEKDFATYDPKFEQLHQENTLIMQYFQSWKYFRSIRETVTREFRFKERVQVVARKILERHAGRTRNRTVVGIHVRRGDMNAPHHIRKGYHIAPASYVNQAVAYMRKKHPGAIFLLVTDDTKWARANLDMSDIIVVDWSSAEVHLCVLASCHHVIMTVGTYGWWGGYLAGGEVVYYWDPEQMLHKPPLPVEVRHPEDFFLPDWVPLSGL